MRTSSGALLPGPHLQATARPWECPSHLSKPRLSPVSVFLRAPCLCEGSTAPGVLLRLGFPTM